MRISRCSTRAKLGSNLSLRNTPPQVDTATAQLRRFRGQASPEVPAPRNGPATRCSVAALTLGSSGRHPRETVGSPAKARLRSSTIATYGRDDESRGGELARASRRAS